VAHESAHIYRKDNLWRIIAVISASVHWFNPLIWLFLKKFLEDTELACDEQVLANCGEDEKKAYAMALVDCAESMVFLPHRSVEQKYGCVLTVFCLTGSCQLFRLQV